MGTGWARYDVKQEALRSLGGRIPKARVTPLPYGWSISGACPGCPFLGVTLLGILFLMAQHQLVSVGTPPKPRVSGDVYPQRESLCLPFS